MIGIPLGIMLIKHIGSARSLFFAACCLGGLLPLCGTPWLVFGIFGIGFSSALIDLSNSSHAVTLETILGINIIGSLQATNSFGNLCGVLVGGICNAYLIPPFLHFILLGIVGSVISYQFFQFLVDADTERLLSHHVSIEPHIRSTEMSLDTSESLQEIIAAYTLQGSPLNSSRKSSGSSRNMGLYMESSMEKDLLQEVEDDIKLCGCNDKLFILSILGFANMLSIACVNNWCTLYFSSTLMTSPFLTSSGYAAFEFFVMLGQLLSDRLVTKFGPRNLLLMSGFLACAGMFVVVSAPSMPWLLGLTKSQLTCSVSWSCTASGVLGYAITGAGLSCVGPVLVSFTGKLPVGNTTPAERIGILTGGSYVGMLFSPVIFGELSMLLGQLQWALLVDAFLIMTIPLLSLYLPKLEISEGLESNVALSSSSKIFQEAYKIVSTVFTDDTSDPERHVSGVGENTNRFESSGALEYVELSQSYYGSSR